MLCDECKKRNKIALMRGDGKCKKHGRYWAGWRNQPCPSCAKENGLCQRCGEKMPAESKS